MTQPLNQLGIVKRNIVRADKAAVERLSRLGVVAGWAAQREGGLVAIHQRLCCAECAIGTGACRHPGAGCQR